MSSLSSTDVDRSPLVSVIIPCYNGAAFLEESIESVLGQTYSNVEILVIDDGSTDNSGEIARRFPVRYLRQESRGVCAARNAGIAAGRGAYLVFLDADDRLLPTAIEAGLRVMEPHPEYAMAVGEHLFFSEERSWRADPKTALLRRRPYEALLKSNLVEMIASAMFRRSIFDEVGGFDPNLRAAEDYEMYLRIAREHSIGCHDSVIAEYRLHGLSASRDAGRMLTMTLEVMNRQAPFIQGKPARRRAYRVGLRSWRRQYGRQLTADMVNTAFAGQTNLLRRKLWLLLRHYPQGVLMFIVLRMMPRAVLTSLRDRRRRRHLNEEAQRRSKLRPVQPGDGLAGSNITNGSC